jgi:hypothetical protein
LKARILNYNINNTDSLLFFGDELNDRHDFYVSTNTSSRKVDVLIFMDSRGISSCFEGSISEKIIQEIEEANSYILVARPLEITTWMSLYNFVKLNNIKTRKIITNMGFVDFTPKKMSIIKKSIDQYNCFFSHELAKVEFLEQFLTEDNKLLNLYIQTYPENFKSEIVNYFEKIHFLIINTPLLQNGFKSSRARPSSFFKSILISNLFNKSLELDAVVFDFKDFTINETYDGVHYTSKGNDVIFSSLKKFL